VNGPEAELGAVGYPRDFRDQSRETGGVPDSGIPEIKDPIFHESIQRGHI